MPFLLLQAAVNPNSTEQIIKTFQKKMDAAKRKAAIAEFNDVDKEMKNIQ